MTKKLDLHEFIRPGNLVFDVGACIGQMTQAYLDCGADVVAFEPNPEMQKRLHERFDEESKVLIDHRGLWEASGTLQFYASSGNPAVSTFIRDVVVFHKDFGADQTWDTPVQEISVTTLDEAFKLYGVPHFMKIDVESAEQYVFRGMHTPVPFLSFEFYPPPRPRTFDICLDLLRKLGYRKFNYIICQAFDYKCIFSEDLVFDDWVDYETLFEAMCKEPINPHSVFGDCYARFE